MAKFEPDDDLIRRLAALLEETGLSEIEFEADGKRIRVGRGGGRALARVDSVRASCTLGGGEGLILECQREPLRAAC